MAINFELRNRLKSKTRDLGTRSDSYLKELFNTLYEYPDIKTFDDFLNESSRMQKASDATIKQFKEVFIMYRLVNEKD